MGRTLIGRIAFFTCANIAHIEFYLQGLLPKILAICTIKVHTGAMVRSVDTVFINPVNIPACPGDFICG